MLKEDVEEDVEEVVEEDVGEGEVEVSLFDDCSWIDWLNGVYLSVADTIGSGGRGWSTAISTKTNKHVKDSTRLGEK